MRVIWAAANVAAVCILTALSFLAITALPIPWDVIVAVFHSAPWHWLQGGVAALRAALGAYGPEENELLLGQLAGALSLAIAIGIVWTANRAISRAMTQAQQGRSRIAA